MQRSRLGLSTMLASLMLAAGNAPLARPARVSKSKGDFGSNRSKYQPHQGKKEIARRLARMQVQA